MYEIESNIPLPPRRNTKASKYPWTLMDIDQSFVVDNVDLKSMRSTAYAAGKRHGLKFVARQDGDVVRVWRTE